MIIPLLTKAVLYDPFQGIKLTIDERNQVSAITSYLANGTGGKGEFANVSIVANGTTYKLAPDFHCGRGIAEGA